MDLHKAIKDRVDEFAHRHVHEDLIKKEEVFDEFTAILKFVQTSLGLDFVSRNICKHTTHLSSLGGGGLPDLSSLTSGPVPHNAYMSFEFVNFIAREMERYFHSGRSGVSCKTFDRIPDSAYFSQNIPKTPVDILKCGVIVDKSIKSTTGANSNFTPGRLSPQGYDTMMIPSEEQKWIRLYLEDPKQLDPKPDDDEVISLGGYVGMTSRGALDSRFVLWRFHLLTRGMLKKILRSKRHLPISPGSDEMKLKAKHFTFPQRAPFTFLIALPRSDSNLAGLQPALRLLVEDEQDSLHPLRRKRRRTPADDEDHGSSVLGALEGPAGQGACLVQGMEDAAASESTTLASTATGWDAAETAASVAGNETVMTLEETPCCNSPQLSIGGDCASPSWLLDIGEGGSTWAEVEEPMAAPYLETGGYGR
jgi:hypothetical protein